MLLRVCIIFLGIISFSGGLIAYLHEDTDVVINLEVQEILTGDDYEKREAEKLAEIRKTTAGDIIKNQKENPPSKEVIYMDGKPNDSWQPK